MLTPNRKSPPGEAGFKAHELAGEVQANSVTTGPAATLAVSDQSGATSPNSLLARWKLLGRAVRDSRLSRSNLAVLHAITDRIGHSGTAWPSIERIARDTSADKRTVSRSIDRLCRYGYLHRQSGSFTTSNVYRLGMGECAGRGEAVAGYGRTCQGGRGELAHVIHPLNPLIESSQKNLPEPEGSSHEAKVISSKGGDESKAGKSDQPSRKERLSQATRDAIETFNASKLTKANGGLVPNVVADVGFDSRCHQVAKCFDEVRSICKLDFDSDVIVRDFWVEYWDLCNDDEHKSGRAGGGKDHGNWVPTFEYLTRAATVIDLYDRVAGGQPEGY